MSESRLLFESAGVDSITTYNLGDFIVVVRENKQLARHAVTISTIGDIPEGALIIDDRGKRVRLKGNKGSRSLLRLSTDVVEESNGTILYDNGLTVTKEFTDKGIVVTYLPKESEVATNKMTIIIEVYGMLTHVTLDGDSVDLWPKPHSTQHRSNASSLNRHPGLPACNPGISLFDIINHNTKLRTYSVQ